MPKRVRRKNTMRRKSVKRRKNTLRRKSVKRRKNTMRRKSIKNKKRMMGGAIGTIKAAEEGQTTVELYKDSNGSEPATYPGPPILLGVGTKINMDVESVGDYILITIPNGWLPGLGGEYYVHKDNIQKDDNTLDSN